MGKGDPVTADRMGRQAMRETCLPRNATKTPPLLVYHPAKKPSLSCYSKFWYKVLLILTHTLWKVVPLQGH